MAASETISADAASVDNFTNDSAMMIAWERALESKRGEGALFDDPLAGALAGTKGERLSADFENMCEAFEFAGWREFHQTWVAVRTRYIDDFIAQHAAAGGFAQLVNLGAGMDTRPYRLECYSTLANGAFDVVRALGAMVGSDLGTGAGTGSGSGAQGEVHSPAKLSDVSMASFTKYDEYALVERYVRQGHTR